MSDAGTTRPDRRLHFSIQQLVGDYSAEIAAALDAPDPPLPTIGGCPLDWNAVVYVLILDDQGRSYRSYIPQDHCGVPIEQVTVALKQLRLGRTYETSVPCDRRC